MKKTLVKPSDAVAHSSLPVAGPVTKTNLNPNIDLLSPRTILKIAYYNSRENKSYFVREV